MRFVLAACVLSGGALLGLGCAGGSSAGKPAQDTATVAHPDANGAEAKPAGAIDVCGRVTSNDAAGVVGPLAPQPTVKTESMGFGIYQCMYLGRALSGQGAQTIFARLTVSAGSGKDASDLLQNDADKRHATIDLPGIGDTVRRNEAGTFVWASRGGIYCTAEISHLPPGLSADSAASQLAALCQKTLSK